LLAGPHKSLNGGQAMILACLTYSLAVMAVLGFMIRTEHKHSCSKPEPVKPDDAAETKLGAKVLNRRDGERITSALQYWIVERSESDSRLGESMTPDDAGAAVCPPCESQPQNSRPAAAASVSASASVSTHADPAERLPDRETPQDPVRIESVPDGSEHSMLGGLSAAPPETSYYELLQISPNADFETIQRVYRFMASRFHPDNPKTGDNEKFLQLKQAFEVLSDPARRAEYDTTNKVREPEPLAIFGHEVFLDAVEGEMNRRLGILSLLYYRRRVNEAVPGLSLLELENLMAFPREYLEFTIWYLRGKGYVAVTEQNSDYTLTVMGADYVETHSLSNHVVRELLARGTCAGLLESAGQLMPTRRQATRSMKENARRRRRPQRPGPGRTLEKNAQIPASSLACRLTNSEGG